MSLVSLSIKIHEQTAIKAFLSGSVNKAVAIIKELRDNTVSQKWCKTYLNTLIYGTPRT